MRKKRIKKIALSKETLLLLESFDLVRVGGAASLRTECGSCPASKCHPTLCPFTVCSDDC